MSLSITLTINGIRRTVELEDPRVTLLDLLRERLDLTGTKKGNLCRCGAYRGITEAVLEAQQTQAQDGRKEAA